jgi:hypothetical protein
MFTAEAAAAAVAEVLMKVRRFDSPMGLEGFFSFICMIPVRWLTAE